MALKQGSISCTTSKPTWDAPDDGPGNYNRYGTRGCTNTFDETKPVSLWIYSDSDNDVYIKCMGVTVGDEDKEWCYSGDYVAIDSDENNGWYQAD